jgi:hypothetical protein
MSTTPPSSTPGQPGSASQIQTALTTALSGADTSATQATQNLQLVHQARLSALSRTAAILKTRYPASDPHVVAAEAAVAATTATAGRAAVASQQLGTPAPQIATDGWAVHGRVFTATFQPMSGLTVFLVDARKAYQQKYGFAYTDDTGYFLINCAASPAGTAIPPLFIEVTNQSGKPVFLDTSAFQPVLNAATYRSIVLPPNPQPIGSPPSAVRRSAFPGSRNKP